MSALFSKYIRILGVSIIMVLSAVCGSLAANVTPIYRQNVPNLAPPGGIAKNPNLDQSIETPTEEMNLIDHPPALAAFVYTPSGSPPKGGWPAVIMVGGHTGIYTSTAGAANRGQAASLSNRSKLWTAYMSNRGYVVYLLDDFTSYGTKFIRGFPYTSADKRPGWASAASARPYYIYSALNDLGRNFPKVNKSRIYLLGWSNGGTATLSTFATSNTPIPLSMTSPGAPSFKSALALYPACGMENRYAVPGNGVGGYNTAKPIFMLNASKDREIDTRTCTTKLMNAIRQNHGTLGYRIMMGAEHTFDANNQDANRLPANIRARDYALRFAPLWFR